MAVTTPPHLTRSSSVKLHGRTLERGVEFSVKGRPGRYRFVEFVEHESWGSWITGYGGDPAPGGRRRFVSVAPSSVRTVHVKKKLR